MRGRGMGVAGSGRRPGTCCEKVMKYRLPYGADNFLTMQINVSFK
jgi:hypothetical protein